MQSGNDEGEGDWNVCTERTNAFRKLCIFFERKISTTTMTSLGTRETNVFNSRSRYFTITPIIVFFRDYFLVARYRISDDCYLLNISNYVDLFWIITVPSKTTCKKRLSNAEVLENTPNALSNVYSSSNSAISQMS